MRILERFKKQAPDSRTKSERGKREKVERGRLVSSSKVDGEALKRERP